MRWCSSFHAAQCRNASRSKVASTSRLSPPQHVQVERCRHAGRIVVGALDDCAILEQVDTDQQRTPAADRFADRVEQRDRFERTEVADRGAGEERHPPRRAADDRRQRHELAEVLHQRVHGQRGKSPPHGTAGGLELHRVHVERHVAVRVLERVEQQLRLAPGTGAVLDDGSPRPATIGDLRRMGREQTRFRTGEVVLGLLADLLEQLRTAGVVQEYRGQLLLLLAESLEDQRDQWSRRVGRRKGRAAQDVFCVSHAVRSLASRIPVNCQRASGLKKLRYVARTCPEGVTHEPPRNTYCWAMNLPLYSPSAPGSGWKPG